VIWVVTSFQRARLRADSSASYASGAHGL